MQALRQAWTELCNLLTFLQADGCDYLTGENIAIDGGSPPGGAEHLRRARSADGRGLGRSQVSWCAKRVPSRRRRSAAPADSSADLMSAVRRRRGGEARDLRGCALATPDRTRRSSAATERLSYAELEAPRQPDRGGASRGLGLARGDHVASLFGNRPGGARRRLGGLSAAAST